MHKATCWGDVPRGFKPLSQSERMRVLAYWPQAVRHCRVVASRYPSVDIGDLLGSAALAIMYEIRRHKSVTKKASYIERFAVRRGVHFRVKRTVSKLTTGKVDELYKRRDADVRWIVHPDKPIEPPVVDKIAERLDCEKLLMLLPDRWRAAMIASSDGATGAEIGRGLGVSDERARQLLRAGQEKIRKVLKNERKRIAL